MDSARAADGQGRREMGSPIPIGQAIATLAVLLILEPRCSYGLN
jgi:hypothetical protein